VVQLAIVENHEPRIPGQVGPHVVVALGIAELIHDQVVGVPKVFPDEVVRVVQEYVAIRTLELIGVSVNEEIDRIGRRQTREQLGVVLGDA
jgi:hypothetical protein